jgi:hypothetical protein
MKRNWIRTLIGGLSFTSAMFIFQACYGTPQDFGNDLFVEGQVKSKTSGTPIQGIKVSIKNNEQYEITDKDGQFSLYTEKLDQLSFQFSDIDSSDNGHYLDKDTTVTEISERVYLDIALEEQTK